MKKLIGLFCVCVSFVSNAQSSLDATDKRDFYMNSITVKELQEQLFILAADDFEGRETSKPGQKKEPQVFEHGEKEALEWRAVADPGVIQSGIDRECRSARALEYLNAVVFEIRDKYAPLFIHGNAPGQVEPSLATAK